MSSMNIKTGLGWVELVIEEIYSETQENKGSMPVLIWANNNIGSILINTDLRFEYDPGPPKLDCNLKRSLKPVISLDTWQKER